MARREPPVDPPAAAEECKWHPWNEDANGPFDGRPCPECEAEREAYEDGAYDRWKDDQLEADWIDTPEQD